MSKQNSLVPAIQISHKILKAINEADLVTVTALEADRQALIKDYFTSSSDVDEKQTRQLKQLNDDILKRLEEMQLEIRSQQISLGKGSRASKAYLDNVAT
jgi:hypothetical protein